MIKLKNILTEAKDKPKVGDQIAIVTSSQYVQKIVKVSGGYVVVDNKSGKGAPAIILGKDKKGQLKKYKSTFKIKINNLKKTGGYASQMGGGLWVLKKTKKAIDGRDLEFDNKGRMVFGFVNEGKLNEGAKTVTLPNGVKVKIDFKGLTFIGGTKPVFLDRNEMMTFFQATRRYLK